MPHMNFSAHSGVHYLSFDVLVGDFVFSVGLYYIKSKGHRNFLVLHFQVMGLIFALGTNINGNIN